MMIKRANPERNPYNELSTLEAGRKLQPTFSIIPLCGIKGDRFKRPNVSQWSSFQSQKASLEQVERWFKSRDMIGIICGAISGGLEVIDFEGNKEFPKWLSLVKPELGSSLFDQLPICVTPSGGVHVYLRSESPQANQVLARTPDPKRGKGGLLIETRGQGGYVATGPGFGYRFLQGDPSETPCLTGTGREIAIFNAQKFNEVGKPEIMKVKGASDLSGKLPGQVFNKEAEWADILEPHGWTFSGRSQQHLYWCRPGKDCGTSAASGYGGERDWLCVFSSNAEGLEPGLYTKFAVYAVLNHDGDFHEAASDLYHQGFRAEESPLSDFDFRGFFE